MNVKRKGNNYERKIVRFFKDRGFSKARTTRQASQLLDSCKVDIDFIPFLVQTKSGYKSRRPRVEELRDECHNLIKEHYPEDFSKMLLEKPYLVFHKIGVKENIYMDISDFEKFLNWYSFYTYCEKNHKDIIGKFNDTRSVQNSDN